MPSRVIVKIVSVAGITLGLLIPLLMIRGLVRERSRFRDQARNEVARSWTGPQELLGPVLTVPTAIFETRKPTGLADRKPRVELRKRSTRYLFPDEMRITSHLRTETRRRGLYSVPVYFTTMTIEGTFDARSLATPLEPNQELILDDATLSVSISDNRGIASPPTLTWSDRAREIQSGSGLPNIGSGVRANVGVVDPGRSERYPFRVELELRGMQSLAFTPMAKDLHVTLDAGWPHPSFTGRFLPVEYEIHDAGFQAEWRLSHLATSADEMIAQLAAGDISRLRSNNFGVSLITPVDIYQQATRSVKYGSLFVILTFTAFFLVEISRKLMLHPMQYLLVGLALVLFFLLLLSLSEHMAFGLAYLLASIACVGLVGTYVGSSPGQASNGVPIVATLGGLYGMLYAILRSEDNALLMGSLLLFVALAAVMLLTRKLDWYRLTGQSFRPGTTPVGSSITNGQVNS